MHAELVSFVWPTVFATLSAALAVTLVVCKKATRVARADSVQYIFTATVKARSPGVTYLDFPAPQPPNRDHETVVYGPTILRTFGRTLTKLRFRYVFHYSPSTLAPTFYQVTKWKSN